MKISIITATLNNHGTILDCLQSVFSQTYPEIEYIVVDGASRDGTLELLLSRQDDIDILVSEPDEGIYDALNKGLALASGDVVGFLHADDVFFDNEVIQKVANTFRDDAIMATYGNLNYVTNSANPKVVRRWQSGPFYKEALYRGWMPPHPTLYAKRELYERIGGFDTSYQISSDYHSILKLFHTLNIVPTYINCTMVSMRLGGVSNKSLRNIISKSKEDYRAISEISRYQAYNFFILLMKNVRKIVQFI